MPIPRREPCPRHPSIPKVFCSCQSRGTNENPIFSMIESEYLGAPVIELLKNGRRIHQWDAHFAFGVRKAEILLTCIDVLYEFGWGSDDERRNFQSRTVQEGPHSLRVSVEFFRDFIYSTGELIEEPWLRLESLNGFPTVKGLGRLKCRAIWALREQIGEWVTRNGGWRQHRVAA